MSVAWYPTKWSNWSMPEENKNEINSFFIDEK